MGCFSCLLLNHRIGAVKHIGDSSLNLAFSADPPEHGPGTTSNHKAEEKEIEEQTPAKHFSFHELIAIAGHFSRSRMIGEGGFGKVYKGFLPSGQSVAIKCLNHEGLQGHSEFIMEALLLSHLRHINLVKLVGYCLEGHQRILVYEFMPKGSLDSHLFNIGPEREPLDWNTRMKIALGVARGLEYLHCKANPPVIYRDMKTSNILLDNDFSPKLSDFGLAKLGPVGSFSHISTRVMGTNGYCDPEYLQTGRLNVKCDVYSFGVVLLELITGRMALDNSRPKVERTLVDWAGPILKKKKGSLQLADPWMKGCFSQGSLVAAAAITSRCIREQPSDRPDITEVVRVLEDAVKQSEKWKTDRNFSSSWS